MVGQIKILFNLPEDKSVIFEKYHLSDLKDELWKCFESDLPCNEYLDDISIDYEEIIEDDELDLPVDVEELR